MDLIIILIIMIATGVPIALTMFFFILKASYKNTAWIARQSGNDINDVIWIPDKFRVRPIDGTWQIQFQKMKEKTQSIDGKFWTKFLTKGMSKRVLTFSKDKWDSMEMRRHIRRGIFFYETTEGELFPMIIKKDEKEFTFSLVNQDNRQFIMREIQDINNLTRSKKKEMLAMIAIIVGILVLGLAFIIGGYWENNQHEQNIRTTAEVSMEYAKAVYNITCNGQPTYLDNLKIPGG